MTSTITNTSIEATVSETTLPVSVNSSPINATISDGSINATITPTSMACHVVSQQLSSTITDTTIEVQMLNSSLTQHGQLSGLSGDDHPHYHNDARALTWLGSRSSDDLPEGGANYYYTDEKVDDRVATLLTAGSNINLTYDDGAGSLTIDNTLTPTSPAGSTGNIQYNNAGSFAASSGFSYDATNEKITIGEVELFATGTKNQFVGNNSGNLTMSGSYNVALGTDAGTDLSTGSYNAYMGFRAGYNATTGTANIAIGYAAGENNKTGSYLLCLGPFAGRGKSSSLATGGDNSFIGYAAGQYYTSCSQSIAIGSLAGRYIGSASNNIFIGRSSGYGPSAGMTGQNNIGLGADTLRNITSGEENICIGIRAGRYLEDGASNILIGKDCDAATGSVSNAIALGNDLTISTDASFTVGSSSATIDSLAIGVQSSGNPLISGDSTSIVTRGGLTLGEPSTAPEGTIRYNTTTNKFQGYDGTSWVDFH